MVWPRRSIQTGRIVDLKESVGKLEDEAKDTSMKELAA